MEWQRHEMLIWGQTFPELSHKYRETVCTGAVLLDQPGLIRIYPFSPRYMPDDMKANKWTVISAEIARNPSDPRPESYKISPGSIKVVRRIDADHADGWEERMTHLLRPEHMVGGLEQLDQEQRQSKRSLGIVKVEFRGAKLEKVSPREYDESSSKYEEILRQQELWSPGSKMVPPPKYKPRIRFKCSGDLEEYERVVLDWETIQLGRHHWESRMASKDFERALREKVFRLDRDPYLILGNISSHPNEFVVVCILYPPRKRQAGLFTGGGR